MPKSDEAWENLIAKFIKHILDRYGKDEVESWYFEVWNEPNLPLFFSGTKEDYFHLYEITVRTAKKIDEKLRFGELRYILQFLDTRYDRLLSEK